MTFPNFNEEKKLWKKGMKIVVGIDEAGRGPLAGPVVAGAVAIISNFKSQISKLRGLNDSKKLSPKAREKFYKILTTHSGIFWGIGKVSEKAIDKINIKNAAELAMEKALLNLEKKVGQKADFLIIDGNRLSNSNLLKRNFKLIVKADQIVFSCAAASILAKVFRDRIMEKYHKKIPQYQFQKHKGYPTKLHYKLLKKNGPSFIHRQSFTLEKKVVK